MGLRKGTLYEEKEKKEENKVIGVLPTEGIHLELKKGFEDFNYLMEDGSIKHFEFQSTNEGKIGLKRFRMYESQMSYQHNKPVSTYILFSGSIQNPMTEFTEGMNTYRIYPIIMRGKNADKVIGELQRKVEAWLIFLSDDNPETIIRLLEEYPEFREMYEEVYDLCLNTEKVMDMFSKELLELDRNTVQLMIDEMQDEIDSQKAQLQEKDAELQEKDVELDNQKTRAEIAEKENVKLREEIARLKG